jgi:hypothetical protein
VFHLTQTATGLSWPSGNMMDESLLSCSPNQGLELTASSVRCGPASGSR